MSEITRAWKWSSVFSGTQINPYYLYYINPYVYFFACVCKTFFFLKMIYCKTSMIVFRWLFIVTRICCSSEKVKLPRCLIEKHTAMLYGDKECRLHMFQLYEHLNPNNTIVSRFIYPKILSFRKWKTISGSKNYAMSFSRSSIAKKVEREKSCEVRFSIRNQA